MELSGISVFWTFVAGIISFLSPCVLPLVPAYLSYIAGESLEDLLEGAGRKVRLDCVLLSVLFVMGFATVFILFGASATALGDLMLTWRSELNVAAGIVVILFGLFMMGTVRLAALERELRFHLAIPGGRPAGAYVLGAAFAFGWTPCIGPVLGSILAISAVGSTVHQGMALLAIYSAGLGVPFVVAALFTADFMRHLRRLGRYGRRLQVIAGAVLVLMGVAMLTGYLSDLSVWLLGTFPWLQRIG